MRDTFPSFNHDENVGSSLSVQTVPSSQALGWGFIPAPHAALGSVPPPVPALALRDLSCPISIGADAVPLNTWGHVSVSVWFFFLTDLKKK